MWNSCSITVSFHLGIFSSIFKVVDAKHILQHLREVKPKDVENVAVEQVAFADKILLNKTDLVDEKKLSEITNEIHTGNDYNLTVTENTILYVTQTINDIESWPKQIIIEVSELPNTELTYDNQILTATYNESFNYEWYYQSTIISGETNNHITVEESTEFSDYSVIITHDHCSIELNVETLSILDAHFQNHPNINIYPNPTNSLVYIKISDVNVSDIKEIKIYNSLGKNVYRIKNHSSSKIDSVDLSQLETGLYFINIRYSETFKTFRIIKN